MGTGAGPSATGSRSAQHTGWGTRGSSGVRNSAAKMKEELHASQSWASCLGTSPIPGRRTPRLPCTGSPRPTALSCVHGPTPLSVPPKLPAPARPAARPGLRLPKWTGPSASKAPETAPWCGGQAQKVCLFTAAASVIMRT